MAMHMILPIAPIIHQSEQSLTAIRTKRVSDSSDATNSENNVAEASFTASSGTSHTILRSPRKKRRSSSLRRELRDAHRRQSNLAGDVILLSPPPPAPVFTPTFYGLPGRVEQLFRELRGIKELYEWQKDCLTSPVVQSGGNFILSLPTSSGKTLIAEILILRQILMSKKDALLILPYVSIVQEKIRALCQFGIELDFLVEEYAGNRGRIPPIKRRKKQSLYIATIEKAHSVLNSLIEQNRVDTLGLVVVDELHMLGEGGGRGAILEQLLTKLLCTAGTCQIVGMSATLSNIHELQLFLRANVVSVNFRPVELTEFVKVKNKLYKVLPNAQPEEALVFHRELSHETRQLDPDQLVPLVSEVVPASSCLVFCASKKNCENVALLLARQLPKTLRKHKLAEKRQLYEALRNECDNYVCPVLRESIPCGVAYHHSGLTTDERLLIQNAYLEGILCVICCTSTLAAGVNLPARRVILRSPLVGKDFISRQQYKQMCGRAGRAGLDAFGESITICQPNQLSQMTVVICAPFEKCNSSLMWDGNGGLKSLILSVVGLELASSRELLWNFIQATLLHVQHARLNINVAQLARQAVDHLIEAGLLKECSFGTDTGGIQGRSNNAPLLKIAPLGAGAYKAGLCTNVARKLYDDLKHSLPSMMLSTHLHLIYQVVPYDGFSDMQIDYEIFYQEYCRLSREEKKLAECTAGVTEAYLLRRSNGLSARNQTDNAVNVPRFYTALLLNCLWKQENLFNVAAKFQLPRGFVQSLLQQSATFASSVSRFCEVIEELWGWKALLPDFVKQFAYCVNAELIPLMDLQGVKQGRARQLYNAGYKKIGMIAQTSPEQLMRDIEHLSHRQARQIMESAKMLLLEQLEVLREQADEMFVSTEAADSAVDEVLSQ